MHSTYEKMNKRHVFNLGKVETRNKVTQHFLFHNIYIYLAFPSQIHLQVEDYQINSPKNYNFVIPYRKTLKFRYTLSLHC